MPKNWKIAIYLLGFGILTLMAAVFGSPSRKEYSAGEVAGAKTNLVLFTQPEASETPIVEAIDGAKNEVLVEVYLFSDDEVLSALDRAKNRGVSVRVMMEQHPFGGGNVNKVTAERLSRNGIDFKWTNPTFALTHQKSMVIDRKKLFVLNQNLTESAFERNREFNLIDFNSGDVAEAVAIFEADWNRESVRVKEQNLVVSPINSRDKITSLLKSARISIDAEAEVVEDDEIVEILSEKAQHLPVRIIVPDFSRIKSNSEDVKKLIEAKVFVKTLSSPYLHSKLIIVDGERGYVGSVNFTGASMDLNRELGILFSQSDIIEKAQAIFLEDWQNGETQVRID